MKKIILSAFLAFLLLASASFSVNAESPSPEASPLSTPMAVNSNELFWPISAGKVSGDSMFGLKLFKEKIRAFLVFGASDKVKYYTTLSTKRVVEAEKLYISLKDYSNAHKSLDLSKENRSKAVNLLEETQKSGKDLGDSKGVLVDSFEKQISLLNYISSQVPDSEKEFVNSNVSDISNILDSLQE